MVEHKNIIDNLASELKEDENNIALFVTGSVARGEANKTSDLDLLLVTKNASDFVEKTEKGIVVEIKSNTLDGFITKMNDNPMNIYQWLDAKVVFEKEDLLSKLQANAQKILNSYTPPDFPRKWLDSTMIKIVSAKEKGDDMALGFQTSNILWKIVEGFYILNREPLPPSTTAFRRISTLKKLPDNFAGIWGSVLTGNLSERSNATLVLLNFLLNK